METDPLHGEPEQFLQKIPQVTEKKIGSGLSGNLSTIKVMKKEARIRAGSPLIRKLALNILQQAGIKSHHFKDEALAIGEYVKNKVRYVRDPDNIEHLQDPEMLVRHILEGRAQGDCDDMSLLTATLLLAIGHQPKFRAVRYDSLFGNFNHIYVVDYDKNPGEPTQRIVLDTILKDRPIGMEVEHANGEEYTI